MYPAIHTVRLKPDTTYTNNSAPAIADRIFLPVLRPGNGCARGPRQRTGARVGGSRTSDHRRDRPSQSSNRAHTGRVSDDRLSTGAAGCRGRVAQLALRDAQRGIGQEDPQSPVVHGVDADLDRATASPCRRPDCVVTDVLRRDHGLPRTLALAGPVHLRSARSLARRLRRTRGPQEPRRSSGCSRRWRCSSTVAPPWSWS